MALQALEPVDTAGMDAKRRSGPPPVPSRCREVFPPNPTVSGERWRKETISLSRRFFLDSRAGGNDDRIRLKAGLVGQNYREYTVTQGSSPWAGAGGPPGG